MRNNIFTVVFTLIAVYTILGQTNKLRLDSCVAMTKRNYPMLQQNGLLKNISAVNIRGINENWLPKLSMLAQGVYQTEVVQFNFPGTNYNFPHDSYLANLGIDQLLIDGGQFKQQRNIENISVELEVQKNEVELYKLIDRVNQLFIGILLTRENINMLDLYKSNLENRRKNLVSASQNGLALASSLDEIDAELLKNEQTNIEAKDNLIALYANLSLLTNVKIDDSIEFEMIAIGEDKISKEQNFNFRPEMKMFDLQDQLIDARYRLTNKMALPKLSIGMAANYGRPGPNFINQELRFFGSASLNFRWNVSSLYGLSREKSKYQINKDMLDAQRKTFLLSLESSMNTQTAQISSMEKLIQKDKEIIEKRASISAVSASQLDNGKINVTNYLWQLNEEMAAKLNLKIHEIKLMNAKSNYNTTKGLEKF